MKIIKDYEKLAAAIGGGALAIAAYQAYKTKQAADATAATDPSRNPITTAIDLGTHVIGDTYDWLRSGYDNATGRVTGKADEILTSVKAIPSKIGYHIMKPTDLGREAAEAGTKYVWNLSSQIAASGKKQYNTLTNKGFTAMGSAPIYAYDAARKIPQGAAVIANALSGVGSKLEAKAGTVKERALGYFKLARKRFRM